MLPDPYTVYYDGLTDKSVTATLLPQTLDGRTRRALSAPAGESRGAYPELLTISRQVVGRGSAIRDRLACRLEGVSVDNTSGTSVYGTHTPPVVTLVSDFPRNYVDLAYGDLALRFLVGLIRGLETNTADSDNYDRLVFPIILGQA